MEWWMEMGDEVGGAPPRRPGRGGGRRWRRRGEGEREMSQARWGSAALGIFDPLLCCVFFLLWPSSFLLSSQEDPPLLLVCSPTLLLSFTLKP